MINSNFNFEEQQPQDTGRNIRRATKTEIALNEVARLIKEEHRIIFCKGVFYEYLEGYYQQLENIEINKWIEGYLLDEYKTPKANEVVQLLKNYSHIKIDELNNTQLLNLKNGLFDLETFELKPHSPNVLSTVQLQVNYATEALCTKWRVAINEIFEGNQNKTNLFQEYFGLSLTRITKYEKALFCVGEGANGKSTVLSVLEQVVGKNNYSSVPLEKFIDSHFVANLFGKLVNISGETNAKSEVYDSIFKAVLSGDSIEADRKFQDPFRFNPFCKLIFAVNNMPRVHDKSNGFFRRLLILRFNKEFTGRDCNKNLKSELIQELDGIFIWALEGLKRLKDRGYFEEDAQVAQEISEYRTENNNVLAFFGDTCEFDENSIVTKKKIYEGYCSWCDLNGYKSLSNARFGKELKKQYPSLQEHRNAIERYWKGISFKGE